MNTIAATFARCNTEKKKALMPFLTAGFPDERTFLQLVKELIRSGADLIEIGIPFSDPLADGKSIQFSSQKALEAGITLDKILRLLGTLEKNHSVPLIIMSYLNPIRAYGVSTFFGKAYDAGVRGLIIPDLIPEEGKEVEHLSSQNGIDLIYLLAPTSSEKRRKMIVTRSRGFVYLVSVTGVTGARKNLPQTLNAWIRRTKKESPIPVCVGFGISGLPQAKQVAGVADGIIIGSAIVEIIRKSSGTRQAVAAAGKFVSKLRKGIDNA
jgi:tryptophan synthase alpha chain